MSLFLFGVSALQNVVTLIIFLASLAAFIIVPILLMKRLDKSTIIKTLYSLGAMFGILITSFLLMGAVLTNGFTDIEVPEEKDNGEVEETNIPDETEQPDDTEEPERPPVVEKTAEEKILELGFEKFSDRYIWESEVNGTTIMFDTFFGVEKIVYEYESNRDGTLWSYYPNLNEGYIEGPTWDNYCMYDTESNTLVEGTECTQADIDLLLIMVGNYEETLEVIGTTKPELEALITELKN